MDQAKTIHFRRKREGKTNYKKRLKILLSNKIRLVVRKSLKNIYAQLTEYSDDGDLVKVSASTEELKKLGWKGNTSNIPASYLTGYLLGKKAKKSNMKEGILDIGMLPSVKGSRLYAVVKGAKDAGIAVPADKEMLPDYDTVTGAKVVQYAALVKKDAQKYNAYFAAYLKQGLQPESLPAHVESIKKVIDSKY